MLLAGTLDHFMSLGLWKMGALVLDRLPLIPLLALGECSMEEQDMKTVRAQALGLDTMMGILAQTLVCCINLDISSLC